MYYIVQERLYREDEWDDVLAKPFDREIVLGTLKKYLK
jgi:hypothetical protein